MNWKIYSHYLRCDEDRPSAPQEGPEPLEVSSLTQAIELALQMIRHGELHRQRCRVSIIGPDGSVISKSEVAKHYDKKFNALPSLYWLSNE